MKPSEGTNGNCGDCAVASNFALRRFHKRDLDECTGCQARYMLIVELEERGRQVEEAIAENVGVFATRIRDLIGA